MMLCLENLLKSNTCITTVDFRRVALGICNRSEAKRILHPTNKLTRDLNVTDFSIFDSDIKKIVVSKIKASIETEVIITLKVILYRERELFVEDRVERVPKHFGLAGFVFVGDDVDFDIRVRAPSQVHGLQAVGLFDPGREL